MSYMHRDSPSPLHLLFIILTSLPTHASHPSWKIVVRFWRLVLLTAVDDNNHQKAAADCRPVSAPHCWQYLEAFGTREAEMRLTPAEKEERLAKITVRDCCLGRVYRQCFSWFGPLGQFGAGAVMSGAPSARFVGGCCLMVWR